MVLLSVSNIHQYELRALYSSLNNQTIIHFGIKWKSQQILSSFLFISLFIFSFFPAFPFQFYLQLQQLMFLDVYYRFFSSKHNFFVRFYLLVLFIVSQEFLPLALDSISTTCIYGRNDIAINHTLQLCNFLLPPKNQIWITEILDYDRHPHSVYM